MENLLSKIVIRNEWQLVFETRILCESFVDASFNPNFARSWTLPMIFVPIRYGNTKKYHILKSKFDDKMRVWNI